MLSGANVGKTNGSGRVDNLNGLEDGQSGLEERLGVGVASCSATREKRRPDTSEKTDLYPKGREEEGRKKRLGIRRNSPRAWWNQVEKLTLGPQNKGLGVSQVMALSIQLPQQ